MPSKLHQPAFFFFFFGTKPNAELRQRLRGINKAWYVKHVEGLNGVPFRGQTSFEIAVVCSQDGNAVQKGLRRA